MRTLTETFELHGNDMFVRELTDAETNEVAGGTGTGQILAAAVSGAGSTLSLSVTGSAATTNTTAAAAITATAVPTGPANQATLQAIAFVV